MRALKRAEDLDPSRLEQLLLAILTPSRPNRDFKEYEWFPEDVESKSRAERYAVPQALESQLKELATSAKMLPQFNLSVVGRRLKAKQGISDH